MLLTDRQMETGAVIIHASLWIIMPIVSTWLPFYLCCTRFWWFSCLYFIWYCVDFRTPAHGSRNLEWLRTARIWKRFADYFPITLKKTADLPPNRNYIFGCHPHGVLSISSFAHLCTNGTGFPDKFPGLTTNILTLAGQFYFPFRREFGMFIGGCESSKESLEYLLRSKPAGRLIGIVIGGAEEALDAHHGRHILNLKHRRGFCKYALKYGAALVPSYSFGENDVFIQDGNHRGTRLRKVQTMIRRVCGFCPPLFYGCGIFSKGFGLLPRRKPILTVVGSPILVEKKELPSQRDIDDLHQLYTDSLIDLFESHKNAYGLSDDVHLEIH